jgi:hypothetical protein
MRVVYTCGCTYEGDDPPEECPNGCGGEVNLAYDLKDKEG